MLSLTKLFFVLVVTLWIISCENPSESVTVTTKVNIDDVWFDDFIDTDTDGYYSDANLYFNVTSNTNNVKVFINLGIRKSTDDPDELYNLCFESEDLTLNNESDNIWYVPVHNLNYQLEQANYDFLVRVYKSENSENFADEVSPSEDPDLFNIALESDTTDLYTEWITSIDDDILESHFTYYPRVPLGGSYVSLAQKFEKPVQAGYFKLLEARLHIPYIYSSPANIGLSIRDDNENEPNETLASYLLSTSSTGWNQFTWGYDLTDNDIFYISVAPSINYAVSLDTNSVERNGYGLWYSTGNPPSSYWRKWDDNIAIEVFIGYSMVNSLAKLYPKSSSAKMCRRRL
jgi:hypothetical protein